MWRKLLSNRKRYMQTSQPQPQRARSIELKKYDKNENDEKKHDVHFDFVSVGFGSLGCNIPGFS